MCRFLLKRRLIGVALVAILIVGFWPGYTFIASQISQASTHKRAMATTPIQHVIVIMLENHSFDSYFGQFPGANGVTLPSASNPVSTNFSHSGPANIADVDGGKMDQFPTRSTIQYSQSDIPIYWNYAKQFGLGDNFFSSNLADSTPNHIYMVASQSGGIFTTSDQQGCKSAANNNLYSKNAAGTQYWSYPCYNVNSLPQLLSNAGISWRYYSGTDIWDAPSMIQGIAGSPDDIKDPGQFINDVQSGNLAGVSWLTPPTGSPSDHPPNAIQGAENFVAEQVNAVMNSQYWNSSAIFVSWDEGGGFYDHVTPPVVDGVGLGVRVPLLVISPYAKSGYISHQQGEFSSFDKFIEEDFSLSNLGQRDALPQTSDLMDYFDFSPPPQPPYIQQPITFSESLVVPHLLTSQENNGIYGAINPEIGGINTSFKFDVVYIPNQTPTVHNVTIDGNSFPMSKVASIKSGGTLYQYTTTLGVGTHGFSFTFTDTGGSLVTIPYNNVPMYGPEVYPFSLTPTVKPDNALPGQKITYSVVYTSPANKAPTLSQVWIDDIPYQMQSDGSTNYQNGVTYTYTTKALSIGQHFYAFHFSDGSGTAVYEGQPRPSITPIELTHTSVSPTSGTTSTPFTFQATYTDSSGQVPSEANVYVDGVAYAMSCSGSCPYKKGAVFQVTMTLPVGKHSFYFVFADSQSSWASPIAPNKYAGPNVGSQVQPVAPGTMIVPDEDDNPDAPLPGDSA